MLTFMIDLITRNFSHDFVLLYTKKIERKGNTNEKLFIIFRLQIDLVNQFKIN